MPEHDFRVPALFFDFPVPGQGAQNCQIAGRELVPLVAKALRRGGEALAFLRAQEDVQPVRQVDEVAQAGVGVMAGRVPGGMVVEDHVADGPRQPGGFAERPARPAVGTLVDFINQIPGFRFHGHRTDIVQDGGGQQAGAAAAAVAQFLRHAQAQPGHARMVSGQRGRHDIQRCGKEIEQIKKTDRPHTASYIRARSEIKFRGFIKLNHRASCGKQLHIF